MQQQKERKIWYFTIKTSYKKNMNKLRYLWVYSAHNQEVIEWHEKLIKARQEAGHNVKGFCCTPYYLNKMRWLSYPELDKLWRIGYPPLIRMYKELLEAIEGCDVLIHYNGANLHPAFVEMLDIFKVYTAGDDPESTEILTKPVANYYDLHLINNIACIDMYKGWGLNNVYFWPLGSLHFPEEIPLSKEDIIDIAKRKKQLVFVGENNKYKCDFFDAVTKAYPQAECWGKGWPKGYIEDADMYHLYINSQIGFNIHNTSGPINFRTYELPAFGVMQICDNKEHLGGIFELGEEVIGFNTVEECIDNIDNYLRDTLKQREIALAGWQRWKKEYTPMAVWDKLVFYTENYYQKRKGVDYQCVTKMLDHQSKKAVFYIGENCLEKIKRGFY